MVENESESGADERRRPGTGDGGASARRPHSDRYGLLFELSTDAVAEVQIVDSVPVVRAVNPSFVDVFGYDREVIVGESLNEFIVPEHRRGEAASFDRRTADGEANWATVSRRTADGIREFLYRGVPFERGDSQHGLAVYTDITDQRRRERHHQVLHRVLRHNLRNDLSRILAATEALLVEEEDEYVREQARRARDAVADLEELTRAAGRVEDMLGSVPTGQEQVDLADALRTVVGSHRRDSDATIETALPESLPVQADARLLDALDALVENAVEHGTAGRANGQGPVAPTIRVAAAVEGHQAVATVTDDGPGIPEYERAAVFDDRPLSQLSHGSGLGLWLAKWVVENYGGRLSYERRGSETTVAARLPVAGADRSSSGQ
ncbi:MULTISPECIES: PAS domain-containing sensor histidine kinase [Salinibaculum]|uniref:PAS domain-containing sensor histidine kinase n=1 Tax=Salinibaculum TaxID=2732368 RepID=UPI0030D32267